MSTNPSQFNVSLVNFGAKNDSPFEFYNSSDTESKLFFDRTSHKYDSFNIDERRIGDILKLYLDYNELNNMLTSANNWFIQNMNIEFISTISGIDYTKDTLSTFNLATCKLCNVFKYILTKDKGVGGFEQTNSSRPSNTIKHYKTLMNASRFLEHSMFAMNINKTYNQINGKFVSPIDGKETPKYSDYFMKGRKEGPNKTKKNYYNDSIIYTPNNNRNFKCMGSLILCLYDTITYEMASTEQIPISFDDKTEITKGKSSLIRTYIENNNIDIMFITEYLNYNSFTNLDDYNVILSDSLDGLTNAIVYKKTLGELSVVTYPSDIDSDSQNEFKEPPLVLENNNMILVCFHAGGKGILENVNKFTDTELYKFISGLDKKVILGGDFNCNIYDNCEIFGINDNSNIAITSFKQRTSVQPQFDKTNKKDKSKKDDFVIQGYNIVDCYVTMLDNGDGLTVTSECDNSYLLPNNNHPFDHFIVNYTLTTDVGSEEDSEVGSDVDSEEDSEVGSDVDSDVDSEVDRYYYFNYIYRFIASFFKSDN
jgi:hypothetical protein